MSAIIGKKLGMTRVFVASGESIPVTVIEAGPCKVTAVRTLEQNGYEGVQLGFEAAKEKHLTKPEIGHLKKNGIAPLRHLKEFREFKSSSEINPGAEVKVDVFQIGEYVKITGVSKGKGFQGVMKRHGFSGAQKTHGQSDRMRAPGSIGQSSYPSRVFKGIKMAGRTGNRNVSVKNLEVISVDADKNILMVRGAVPGAKNGIVYITK